VKFSALNVDFNSVSLDPYRFKESSVRASNLGIPSKRAFLLLSTDLAGERLQIDTNLRLIVTSTADDLSGDTNIDDLE